jgi:hypothetical protein
MMSIETSAVKYCPDDVIWYLNVIYYNVPKLLNQYMLGGKKNSVQSLLNHSTTGYVGLTL